jgi:hypothetical protein
VGRFLTGEQMSLVQSVHTGSGSHRTTYSMGNADIPLCTADRSLHNVARSVMDGNVAGLISQSLQLHAHITLASLGWCHKPR